MKCNFNIKEIENINDGKKYKILVELPMEVGFVNYINFVVEKNNHDLSFRMKHVKNEKGKIYFETELELETCAIYNYYFEFKANNQIRYIDKDKNITNYITRENKSKMSVNFNTPDWAKGKIMYHIFMDRFNRGSKEKLKEMPRRTIYDSFEDDLDDLWITTPYCHIEGAIAFSNGLPILILSQKGLKKDGILKKDDIIISGPEFVLNDCQLSKQFFQTNEFLESFQVWKDKVETLFNSINGKISR